MGLIVWAQSCLGTNVSGHKRVWAQTCVGTNVCGHKRCGHGRVGPIMHGHKRGGTMNSGLINSYIGIKL